MSEIYPAGWSEFAITGAALREVETLSFNRLGYFSPLNLSESRSTSTFPTISIE